jgi:hypothetical protein
MNGTSIDASELWLNGLVYAPITCIQNINKEQSTMAETISSSIFLLTLFIRLTDIMVNEGSLTAFCNSSLGMQDFQDMMILLGFYAATALKSLRESHLAKFSLVLMAPVWTLLVLRTYVLSTPVLFIMLFIPAATFTTLTWLISQLMGRNVVDDLHPDLGSTRRLFLGSMLYGPIGLLYNKIMKKGLILPKGAESGKHLGGADPHSTISVAVPPASAVTPLLSPLLLP